MKNFIEILKAVGIVLTDEQLTSVNEEMKANYKPIADYNKQKEKLDASEDKVKTLTESLDKFKDVDPTALSQQITDLQTQLTNKDNEFAQKMADRDFQDLLNKNISNLKGKNTKAIQALLDIDALKKSQNQEKDIQDALDKLSKANDSAFLFGEVESKPQSRINPIGDINNSAPQPDYLDSADKGKSFHTLKSGI